MTYTNLTEDKQQQKKADRKLLRKTATWFAGLSIAVLLAGTAAKTAIDMYEDAHRTHYMYSSCDDGRDQVRTEANCTRRWAIYHDKPEGERQYKDRSTGQWRVEGSGEVVTRK